MKIILVALLLIAAQAKADNVVDLKKIQDSLNGIRTMQAKILQIDSKKENANGMFYLHKPEKMRIEYKSKKSDIVMVASKQMVTYYDKELDEVSHVPTSTTPATILMQENIDFDKFEILDFEVKNSIYAVTFSKKDAKDDGVFTFTFKHENDLFVLQRIDRYNDEQKTSRLSIFFTDVRINQDIPDKIFVLKDKRIFGYN